MNLFAIPLLITVVFMAGCGDKYPSIGDVSTTVTYNGQIKTILDKYCIGCHSSTLVGAARQGAPGGVNFDTYQSARISAPQADVLIQNETMPKTGGPLTQEEKDLFNAWVLQGKLE